MTEPGTGDRISHPTVRSLDSCVVLEVVSSAPAELDSFSLPTPGAYAPGYILARRSAADQCSRLHKPTLRSYDAPSQFGGDV